MLLHSEFAVLLSLLLAFIIVFTSIPTIVTVANIKKLFDEPGFRKAHKRSIPTLGGIAIFSAVLIATGICTDFSNYKEFQYIVTSAVILFFVGLKDDIIVIAPMKKLSGQLLSVLILIMLGDVRFTSLHGFLGIHSLPYFGSVVLSLFVFVVIINGFNLIDGIDGLASGIGIVASLTFGVWFFLRGEHEYATISVALAGSLIAFFYYNVFGKENKIFMGDTGSLLVGLFLAVLAVRFNEMNIVANDIYFIHAAPAVSFGILIIPLFDTMRVFILRILRGRSPFKADRNHVHHKLLDMGMSHLRASAYIITTNVIIIGTVFFLNNWGIIDLMVLIVFIATAFSLLPEIFYFIKQKRNQLLGI